MFLDASSHFYQRVCPSVGPSVWPWLAIFKIKKCFSLCILSGKPGNITKLHLYRKVCLLVRPSIHVKSKKKGWKDASISRSSLFGLCPMGYEETCNAFPCCWKVSLVYSISFQLQLGFLIVTYRSSLHHFSVFALSAVASLDTISMPFVCPWLFSSVGHAAFENATSFIGNFFCSRQKVSLPSALL